MNNTDGADGGIVRAGGVHRRSAVAWWLPVFVVVVAGSWWPFVAVGSADAWADRFAEAVTAAWIDKLSLVLVLAYLVLGVLTGRVFERRRWRWAVLGLPVLVEFGQTWFLWRHGQWADVALGMASLAIGLRLEPVVADRAYIRQWGVIRRGARVTPALGFVGWSVVCTLVLAGASWKAFFDARIIGWDAGYPVLLGNEVGGGRPWFGTVHNANLRLLPTSYTHMGSGVPIDLAICTTPVNLHGNGVVFTDRLDGNFRAMAESEFESASISATITPAFLDQSGPARIVTWSNGSSRRNFTIGQDGDALVMRIRTVGNGENGRAVAEARWPDVFEAGRQVIVDAKYVRGVAYLMVDRTERPPFPIHTPVRVFGGTTWWHGTLFGAVLVTPLAWLGVAALVGKGCRGQLAWSIGIAAPLLVAVGGAIWGVAGLWYFVLGWWAAGLLFSGVFMRLDPRFVLRDPVR